jgi:hypothetical protein
MSVVHSTGSGNPTSLDQVKKFTPEQVLSVLEQANEELRQFVTGAVASDASFDSTERQVWEMVRKTGFVAMELFIKLQGNGDLGEQVESVEGKTLQRSSEPVHATVRSIFGQHSFEQFTYSAGKNKKVELYSISARMQLPEHQWSYLLQEFSQLFCVDQAFNQASKNLEAIWGAKFSIDTLEQTSRRMGEQADKFLDELPTPKKRDEGPILVASADCKGVPLIKDDTAKVAAFETAKKQPGNRRMATVTSVYSVAPYERTAEDIVAALFRDTPNLPNVENKRPKPKFKHTTAHFPTTFQDGEDEIRISGIHEGIAWLAAQVNSRRRADQPLVLLMDGQECLWDVASLHLPKELTVTILDIIHVSTYVWDAASLFHNLRPDREAFTRERLLRILNGDVAAVIRGLRRMGSLHRLKGDKLRELEKICNYFENNALRMQYDKYLAAGYPIASGVIEGACGHLVKDRMERSGMRWKLESARSMLNVRAAFQSDYWDLFQKRRIQEQTVAVHPNRNLVQNYCPLTLAC